MRLRRMRFSLRWLLIAVALAAIPCWTAARRARFLALAAAHESRIPGFLNGSGPTRMSGRDRLHRLVQDWEGTLHQELAEKYRRAARSPWLIVAPDPDRQQYRRSYSEQAEREFFETLPFEWRSQLNGEASDLRSYQASESRP